MNLFTITPHSALPSLAACSLPDITLAQLCGRERLGNLDLTAIDALLGRETTASLADQASVRQEDLIKAASSLHRLSVSEDALQHAAQFYSEQIPRLSVGPTRAEAHAYMAQQLRLDSYRTRNDWSDETNQIVRKRHEYLSYTARNGLYILLTHGKVFHEHLQNLIKSATIQTVSGGLELPLSLATLLYQQRIENFASLFSPSGNDRKILADDVGRLYTLFNLMDYALWLSRHSDAVRIKMKEFVDFDWTHLTDSEESFLQNYVLPYQGLAQRQSYKQASFVNADLAVTRSSGTRLIKVLTIHDRPEHYDRRRITNLLMQIFRYAQAVKHHNFEGLEYVVHAPRPPESLLLLFEMALDATGIPYQLHMHSRPERTLPRGLELPTLANPAPYSVLRPLPPLPEAQQSAVETNDNQVVPDAEPEQAVAAEPFDSRADMVLYLRDRLAEAAEEKDRSVEGHDAPQDPAAAIDDTVTPSTRPAPRPRKRRGKKRVTLPWSKEMQRVLARIWPRSSRGPKLESIKMKQRSASEFIENAQNALRKIHHTILLSNLNVVIAETNSAELRRRLTTDYQRLVEHFSSQGDTVSRETLVHLIQLIALMTGDNIPKSE